MCVCVWGGVEMCVGVDGCGGVYVPHRFPKLRSRGRIFLEE